MEYSGVKTDWDQYYRSPFPAAHFLRAVTSHRLIRALKLCGMSQAEHILEPGGGNSCFAKKLCDAFRCREYTIAESCERGIHLFQQQNLPCRKQAVRMDLVKDPFPVLPEQDLVFSAGLIEHFSAGDTALLIRKHFELLKPGGFAAFLFPADTGLYRFIRGIAERTGSWKFPDERPLTPEEVLSTASQCGRLCHRELIRIILLTQGMVIMQKE